MLRDLCQTLLADDPDTVLDVYIPDFREEFPDLLRPVIVIDDKDIISISILSDYDIFKEKYTIAINIPNMTERMSIEEFGTRKLGHIRECAVVHFTIKN
ncbi:MAG TPA: hypothetical protein PK830_04880 [Candidatus Atribacteria bacterium]|nr:hypothetical protein [Candidatus Atribacteria bacterium]HPT78417.1 hypothetical protein [Candidatus Atribacteria bacterium]